MNTKKYKAYVAGRITRQDEVHEIVDRLKAAGIEITREWMWSTTEVTSDAQASAYRKRSYAEPQEKYRLEAKEDIDAVLAANLFIILTDENGTSMYVEMGAALASCLITGEPSSIYAIGPHFDRMVMYQHPLVKWVSNIEEVLKDLEITQ
jgi:hypothetical protein